MLVQDHVYSSTPCAGFAQWVSGGETTWPTERGHGPWGPFAEDACRPGPRRQAESARKLEGRLGRDATNFSGSKGWGKQAGSGRAGMCCLEVTGCTGPGQAGGLAGLGVGVGLGAQERHTLSHLDSAHRSSPQSHATGAGCAGACGALPLPQPPPLPPPGCHFRFSVAPGSLLQGTPSWGLGRGEAPSGTGPLSRSPGARRERRAAGRSPPAGGRGRDSGLLSGPREASSTVRDGTEHMSTTADVWENGRACNQGDMKKS